MLTLAEKVYLAGGSTDLRKSIDGLAVLVQERFQPDPFAPCLFVFCNRQRDKLKMLYWNIMASGCCTVAWNVEPSSPLRTA
ncbi:transposase [Paenibacillus sp. FSL R7-269]|uniref:IS66 family insertion sequence element accessory protein TnpB n=1 Tax=Paenibacillus sp. FSL R7-269 TaxID=1226755 RepID=UPI0003E1BA2F|nr:transposase [Paenibacillus sp. FSL R7-269]